MFQKLLQARPANRNGRIKPVYQINAIVGDKQAWYYIEVESLKAPLLEKAIAAGQGADLEQYGVIVASGWGETPPAAVQRRFEGK